MAISGTLFPAVLVGGPPHSGKSVLVYSLTRALREARVEHYVLRACPDGEGDWANEADQQLVRQLRAKGDFTPAFVQQVVTQLQQRHLPLLVDVGGKPKVWQEAILAACTHAILLEPTDSAADTTFSEEMAYWQGLMDKHGVRSVARLQSNLWSENTLWSTSPVVEGRIAGLERGEVAQGETFVALIERVSQLFRLPNESVTADHLARAPVEITLHLPELAETLGAVAGRWEPGHLADLVEYLPEQTAMAAYGRAPLWVYGMLAWQAYPADIWQFDPRLGWIEPPKLVLVDEPVVRSELVGWKTQIEQQDGFCILHVQTKSHYLDIEQPALFPFALPKAGEGLMLNGRLPVWLAMSLVRHLGERQAWIAVYQPALQGAVIVASKVGGKYAVGKQVDVITR